MNTDNSIQDCEPFRFAGDENGWQLVGSLEKDTGAGAGGAREESALNLFRQMDLKGQTQADTKLKSTHQNTVNTIRAYDEANGQVRSFSSKCSLVVCGGSPMLTTTPASGVDGRVVVWSL